MRIIAIIIPVLLSVLPSAQASLTPASTELVYGTSPENRDWLTYFRIDNKFRYGQIRYDFGEIRLEAGNASQRIPLVPLGALAIADGIQAAPGTGESSDLLAYTRSRSFTIPQSPDPRIHFMRNLHSTRHCQPESGGSGGGSTDWDVVDRSEFVVYLLRESDGEILARLDSVGTAPFTGAYQDSRYGENVEFIIQSRTLPEHVAGETVYLQISPRRYGPSPYGLILNQLQHQPWNYSAVHSPRGHLLGRDSAEAAQFEQAYFDAIVAYCDAEIATTGIMPETEHFFLGGTGPDGPYFDIFLGRYYEPIEGSSAYRLQAHILYKTGHENDTQAVSELPLGEIRTVAPNPLANSSAMVTLHSYMEIPALLHLYNTSGQTLATLWHGTLQTGETRLELRIDPTIANGRYFLHLEDRQGTTLAAKELVIAR